MIDPGAHLARLDEAFAVPESDLPTRDATEPGVCDACRSPVRPLPGAMLTWCARCRRAFAGPERRYLCSVPPHWSAPKFTTWWDRGLAGRVSDTTDRSFLGFIGTSLALDPDEIALLIEEVEPRPILLGALAREHELLAEAEVDWILELQRSTPAHRRRCFGAIAVELGLWRPRLVPRLLAAQAERTRGAATALLDRLGLPAQNLVPIERAFFGLSDRSEQTARWPICTVLAEDEAVAAAAG